MPGRPDQEHTLGDLGPDLLEAVGRAQEVDDLADLELHTLVARYVGEGRPRALRRVHLGLRSADRHDAAHLTLGASAQPHEHEHEKADPNEIGEKSGPGTAGRGDQLQVLDVGGVLLQCQGVLVYVGALDGELLALLVRVQDVAAVLVDRGGGDVAGVHSRHELAVGLTRGARAASDGGKGESQDGDCRQDHGDPSPVVAGRGASLLGRWRTARSKVPRLAAHGPMVGITSTITLAPWTADRCAPGPAARVSRRRG